MSFGISAVAWTAIGAAASVGVGLYSANQQRKAIGAQQDALNASIAADARKKVEAETSASLSANQKLAADKRSRQANVLALGGNSDSTLGQPVAGGVRPNVLAQGAGVAARSQAASPGGSVLGGGAPSASPGGSTGRVYGRGGAQP